MAKNYTTTTKDSESQGMCEKIFKTMSASPTFRPFRRISQCPKPASTAASKPSHSALREKDQNLMAELNSASSRKTSKYHEPAMVASSNMVLVEYNHRPGVSFMPVNKPSVKIMPAKDHGTNERFTDYIDRFKNKMKATSSFGGAGDDNGGGGIVRAATRRDSFNDKVSHYINRAKLKIRTTTIVGGSTGDYGDGK